MVKPRAILPHRRVPLLKLYLWSSYFLDTTSCLSSLTMLCTLYTESSIAVSLNAISVICTFIFTFLFGASLDQMVHL
jgi:hypothetical protein